MSTKNSRILVLVLVDEKNTGKYSFYYQVKDYLLSFQQHSDYNCPHLPALDII